MKHLKRLLAVLMAVMMLCMCVTVFAEPTEEPDATAPGSITLNGTIAGKEYRLYRIFDLTYVEGSDPLRVSYTIAENWNEFFTTGAGAQYLITADEKAANDDLKDVNLSQVAVGDEIKYIAIVDANAAEFATAAFAYAASSETYESVTAEGTTTVASDLALGYYLVYPVGATEIVADYGSICSLTNTLPDGTVVIKAQFPTFIKTVEELEIEGVQEGQTLPYALDGTVPDTTGYEAYTYKFQDTMGTGLTFNKDVTVTVAGVTLPTEYYTLAQTDDAFTLSIDILKLIGKTIVEDGDPIKVGDPIQVKYSAIANKDGLTKIAENKAVLTFTRDPESGVEGTYEQIVPVYTAKIVIDKYDAADEATKLPDAKFVLKKDDNFYKYDEEKGVEWVDTQADALVVTTDENGFAQFIGLEPGTYTLVELEPPFGYNKLPKAVEVTVTGLTQAEIDALKAQHIGELKEGDEGYEDAVAAFEEALAVKLTHTEKVANNRGPELPSTGGIGTTLFYVIGGLLVLVAAILLITKKRMSADR